MFKIAALLSARKKIKEDLFIENATKVEMDKFSAQRNVVHSDDFKGISSALESLNKVYREDQPLIKNQVIKMITLFINFFAYVYEQYSFV